MLKALEPLSRHVVSASRWLFTPTALVFLFIAGYNSRHAVVTAFRSADPVFLMCTVLLCMLLHPLTAMFSRLALQSNDKVVPYRTLLYIQIRRLPARYLPGGIWQTVSRMLDLHKHGLEKKQLLSLALMENAIPLSVALILGGIFLYMAEREWILPICTVLLGILIISLVLFFVKKILRKEQLSNSSSFAAATGIMLIFWSISSLSFFLYWHAFPASLTNKSFSRLASIYLLAWSAGFVAIFAPQGIGVFESTGGFLMHREIPIEYAATIFIGFRIATLTGDALLFTMFTLTRFLHRKLTQNERKADHLSPF